MPTPEHYLPLLYAIALQTPEEKAEFFNVAGAQRDLDDSVLIGGPQGPIGADTTTSRPSARGR